MIQFLTEFIPLLLFVYVINKIEEVLKKKTKWGYHIFVTTMIIIIIYSLVYNIMKSI